LNRQLDEVWERCFPDIQQPETKEFRFFAHPQSFFLQLILFVLGISLMLLTLWAVGNEYILMAWIAAFLAFPVLISTCVYQLAFRFQKQLEWKIDALKDRCCFEEKSHPAEQ